MKKKYNIKLILFFSIFFFSVLDVYAEEKTCYLQAPYDKDIWVIVYSASRDGDRGDVIWKGKIAAGEDVKIKCTTGHIRYQYAMKETQPYEGDLNRWCDSGDKIQLP